MIDLIAQAPDIATLRTFAITHKLGEMVEGEFQPRKGFKYNLWSGSGKFLTKAATYDGETRLTAPTYAAGVVAILRFRDDFFIPVTQTVDGEDVTVKQGDTLEVDPEADNTEQHTRSRIARYVKNNGTKGKTGTINHWKLGGVKLYRYQDVMDFLEAKGLPKYVHSGGNKP